MNEPVLASDQTPRIWAAAIEQTGALLVVAAQFVVAQHLYSTYLEHSPEKSWLLRCWNWYQQQLAYRRASKWVNSKAEVELIGS